MHWQSAIVLGIQPCMLVRS